MHTRENIGKNLTHTCTRKNCGKKFANMYKLERHLKIHDNDVIRCFYCQWAGTQYQQYSIHMNTHFRNKTHKCQICPQAFYDHTGLFGHMELLHYRNTEKYKCDHCDFKSYSNKIMSNHKRRNCKY